VVVLPAAGLWAGQVVVPSFLRIQAVLPEVRLAVLLAVLFYFRASRRPDQVVVLAADSLNCCAELKVVLVVEQR
jgi:hypothetical protein